MFVDDAHVTVTSNNKDGLFGNAHEELLFGMGESRQISLRTN